MYSENEIKARLKALIPMLIKKGKIINQEDLGKQLGYPNKSYLSQLINGKANNSRFLSDLIKFDSEINSDWLYNGIGPMFKIAEAIKAPNSIADLISEQNQKITLLENENNDLKNENLLLKREIEEYKKNDVKNLDNFFELLTIMNEKVDDNTDRLENIENLIKTQQSA